MSGPVGGGGVLLRTSTGHRQSAESLSLTSLPEEPEGPEPAGVVRAPASRRPRPWRRLSRATPAAVRLPSPRLSAAGGLQRGRGRVHAAACGGARPAGAADGPGAVAEAGQRERGCREHPDARRDGGGRVQAARRLHQPRAQRREVRGAAPRRGAPRTPRGAQPVARQLGAAGTAGRRRAGRRSVRCAPPCQPRWAGCDLRRTRRGAAASATALAELLEKACAGLLPFKPLLLSDRREARRRVSIPTRVASLVPPRSCARKTCPLHATRRRSTPASGGACSRLEQWCSRRTWRRARCTLSWREPSWAAGPQVRQRGGWGAASFWASRAWWASRRRAPRGLRATTAPLPGSSTAGTCTRR